MSLLIVLLSIATAVILISLGAMPYIQDALASWRMKRDREITTQLDALFYEGRNRDLSKILKFYYALPVILGVTGLVVYQNLIGLFAGAIIGLFIPSLLLRMKDAQRRMKFDGQILNAIMIMSSSLKGGLSLLQALEVVAEEMPAPMSQEISLVVGENKMGVPLEEALKHLNNRMKLSELTLLINSILVAKGTGGDLTKVFSRLSTTIRDNRKLRDSIKTLTMQGRMQGIIMSALPFIFIWWVFTFNRNHFDIMLQSDTGRMLIFVGIFLQVVGMVLIRRFSTIRI